MYTSSIFLANIEAVKKFVTLTNNYDFQINLTTDKYKIDAKSIMGIFSLDLSKPIKIEVEDDGSENGKAKEKDFVRQLHQFECKKVPEKVPNQS